jgi:ABC-type transport system involved in multi-copper enzyme maturation permease subunit
MSRPVVRDDIVVALFLVVAIAIAAIALGWLWARMAGVL